MSGEDDPTAGPSKQIEARFQAPATETKGQRPAANDVRAVVLAVYRDPARFKPLMQASSPVPPGFIDLLRSVSGPGAFSEPRKPATADGDLAKAALFYLNNVLLADPGNYYRVLGLSMDATKQEIQQSYSVMRQFLARGQGDAPNARQIDLVSKAYVVLNDPGKRRDYDRVLLTGATHRDK